MNHLAHSPSAVAVGRVELGVAKAGHRRPQALREQSQGFDMRGAHRSSVLSRRTKSPYGVSQIFLIGHGKNLPRPGAAMELRLRSGRATGRLHLAVT
jgi:hypothetical protein